MIVDLAPSFDFILRFLLLGVTAGLVAFITTRYIDAALVGSLWGVREPVGCYLVICIGLVTGAVLVSYWVF